MIVGFSPIGPVGTLANMDRLRTRKVEAHPLHLPSCDFQCAHIEIKNGEIVRCENSAENSLQNGFLCWKHNKAVFQKAQIKYEPVFIDRSVQAVEKEALSKVEREKLTSDPLKVYGITVVKGVSMTYDVETPREFDDLIWEDEF